MRGDDEPFFCFVTLGVMCVCMYTECSCWWLPECYLRDLLTTRHGFSEFCYFFCVSPPTGSDTIAEQMLLGACSVFTFGYIL